MSEVEVEEEYASVSDLADKIDSINQRVSVILQTYRNRNNNSSNRVSEDQLLQALDTQSQQIKQEYNLKLKQVEQDREFEVKRRLEAENEAENVQKLIDDVDVRKRKFRKRIDELLVAIQEANDALEANEEDRALKEKRNMGLEKEQDSLKGEVRELERKLDAESLVFQNVSSYAESFSVKSSNAKKFIETMESEYEKKIEILHKKLTDLKTQQEKKENKFKEEFTKQLTDIVAENQDILETSLEDVLARQKEFYDQSILSIHKTYESSDARIEELEELHANHQKKLEAVKKRFSELDVANENLKNSIKEQQSKLDELKRNPNKEINERNREIRNLKAVIELRKKELREIREAEIRCHNEIETYRQILEDELKRYKSTKHVFKSPPKSVKKPKKDTQKQRQEPILLRRPLRLSLESRSSLRVTSCSINSIDLSGYTLVVTGTDIEVPLPELSLRGGSSVVLLFGPENAVHHSPPESFYIEQVDLQILVTHDELSLEIIDPNNRVCDSISFKTSSSEMEDGEEFCIIA